ncbi:MAG: hypothetical protein K2N63_06765 [Lachnospiraceae bacterium]|nr:hypothetical protein [Lachnospiraceae bacterium]
MILIKSGKKRLLFRTKLIISFLWKNCKLESLIIVLGIFWMNLSWRISGVDQILVNYFDESRCSGITGFTSVVIGIYVTVWSIFATSASKINSVLLKSKVEGPLFFLIGLGLVEAFLATVWCIFVPCEAPHYTELLVWFTVLTAVSFVKFVILVMMITRLNINYIIQEIDEQSSACRNMQVKLDEIYQRTVDKKK